MGLTNMASLSSLSVLLAALLTQGSCLICDTCQGPGKDCTGVSRTCGASQDTCLTFIGVNSLWSDKITETIKVCSDRSSCQPGSTSVTINSEIHFRSIASCCQEDLCNHKELDLPAENTTLNGLTCPACFNIGFDHCEEISSLNCVGQDNHCITASGTLTDGIPVTFASRGCGSASACALPLDTNIYSAGITLHLKKLGCSPALKASSP